MYYQILKSDFYTLEVYDMIVMHDDSICISDNFKKTISDLFLLSYPLDFKIINSIEHLKEDYKLISEADTIEELKMNVMEYLIWVL